MERREWKVVKTIPERPTSDVELVFNYGSGDDALRLPWHRQELLEVIAKYANGYPKAARALNDYKREHTALVAQRDLLVSALRETIPHLDCNCYRAHGQDCVKGKVEHVLATVEQGHKEQASAASGEGREL